MAGDQGTRIEEENASALHMLLTPVRIAVGLLKTGVFIVGSVLLIGCNFAGWLLDIGPRSEHSRQVHIAAIEEKMRHYDGDAIDAQSRDNWFAYQVDFRHQPDIEQPKFLTTEKTENYIYRDSTLHPDQDTWSSNTLYKAFDSTTLNNPTEESQGIPYCVPASPIFDTSLGTWDQRGDSALDRKAARMRRDYEIAAVMTAALRSAIIHLKLHRSVKSIYGPETMYAQNRSIAASYCNALGGMHESQYGAAGAAAYRTMSKQVVLPDAPVIRIQEVQNVPGTTGTGLLDFLAKPATIDRTEGHGTVPDSGMEITGICLADFCSNGLDFGTTYKDDLFAQDPPLTEQQMAAERSIFAMTTQQFWAKEAAENGVLDLAAVEYVRSNAWHDLLPVVGGGIIPNDR